VLLPEAGKQAVRGSRVTAASAPPTCLIISKQPEIRISGYDPIIAGDAVPAQQRVATGRGRGKMKYDPNLIGRWHYFLLLLFACILAGCAASGVPLGDRAAPSRVAPPGKALVYIYRTGGFYGSGTSWELFSNGRYVTRITNGGYYDFEVDPGQIELGVMAAVQPFGFVYSILTNLEGLQRLNTFRAEAGRPYYFKFEVGNKITSVTKDEALEAMTGMNRFDDPKATEMEKRQR
jgi:hypothetical protein